MVKIFTAGFPKIGWELERVVISIQCRRCGAMIQNYSHENDLEAHSTIMVSEMTKHISSDCGHPEETANG